MKRITILASISLVLFMMTGNASAQWSLLSDFEGLTAGQLGSQGGWTSAPAENYHVVADPNDASNQALLMNAPGGDAYISLGEGIADGATGTLFFRARNNNPGDFVFGSSDVAAPAAWGDYEGYMRFASGNLDVRDGGVFVKRREKDFYPIFRIELALSSQHRSAIAQAAYRMSVDISALRHCRILAETQEPNHVFRKLHRRPNHLETSLPPVLHLRR